MPLNSVEEKIREAWASQPRPRLGRIVPEPSSDHEGCLETFKDVLWQQVSREMVKCNRSCVWFFSEDALLYFLPAFMLASLQEQADKGFYWDITHDTLLGITRLIELHLQSGTRLNGERYDAITGYLRFIELGVSAKEALKEVRDCAKFLRNSKVANV